MKKVIALALALTLALSMASVAFAATYAPGKEVDLADFSADTTVPNDIKENYKLSTDWTKGEALVSSVKITKDNKVVLTLKENYTIIDGKELDGVVTLTNRKNSKDVYPISVSFEVANGTVDVFGEKKADDAMTYDVTPDTVYICDEDEAGYVKFSNSTDLLGVTLKMAAKKKVYMDIVENDGDIMDELEEKFPEAEIETYTFVGAPNFKNAADFTLQADYADQYYVYTYNKGDLEIQEYDWNSEDGVYEWSSKAPRTYVLSDVELVEADEEAAEDDKNPDTGANDVVGVAAALAVVSLVAAGAVSLKK